MIDIKKHRERLGLTQVQFGALVGVDGKTVSNWESNKKLGHLKTAFQMFKVFDLLKDEAYE